MSKIQIITKAVVTAIGIYAVFLILSQIIKIYPVIFFEKLLSFKIFIVYGWDGFNDYPGGGKCYFQKRLAC